MARTVAHSNDRDSLICVVSGQLKLTAITSFERLFLYPGGTEDMPSNYSPVNFFKPDTKLH